MDPRRDLADRVVLLISSYLEENCVGSNDWEKIRDSLRELLRKQKKRIIEQRLEEERAFEKKKKLLAEEIQLKQKEFKANTAFLKRIERKLGGIPSDGGDTHRDDDGGHGKNDARPHMSEDDSYPTPTPSEADGDPRESHSPRPQTDYPDLQPSVAPAPDDEIRPSQAETSTAERQTFYSTPIESSSSDSEKTSPSRVNRGVQAKSVDRGKQAKKRSREHQNSHEPSHSNVRRSARPKEKVTYSQ
jgi:hypothetical protein